MGFKEKQCERRDQTEVNHGIHTCSALVTTVENFVGTVDCR